MLIRSGMFDRIRSVSCKQQDALFCEEVRNALQQQAETIERLQRSYAEFHAKWQEQEQVRITEHLYIQARIKGHNNAIAFLQHVSHKTDRSLRSLKEENALLKKKIAHLEKIIMMIVQIMQKEERHDA